MGNIIKITSREIFGLDKMLKPTLLREKKMIVPQQSITLRGKDLYTFIKRL